MSPGIEIERQHRVPNLHHRHVGSHVRLASGMGLDVGMIRAKQGLRPIDRQLLGDVDELAATVVALSRISFGVLVGEWRTHRFEHCRADEVLGGDQLDPLLLAPGFVANGSKNFWIYLR